MSIVFQERKRWLFFGLPLTFFKCSKGWNASEDASKITAPET